MLSSAVSLWELFKGRAFVIPDYQRAYAWTKRQVEDLWKDLKDNVAGSRKHFMGTIILKDLEKSDTTVPYKSYEIVDGQQRLTSLVMLCFLLKLWQTYVPTSNSLTTMPWERCDGQFCSPVNG